MNTRKEITITVRPHASFNVEDQNLSFEILHNDTVFNLNILNHYTYSMCNAPIAHYCKEYDSGLFFPNNDFAKFISSFFNNNPDREFISTQSAVAYQRIYEVCQIFIDAACDYTDYFINYSDELAENYSNLEAVDLKFTCPSEVVVWTDFDYKFTSQSTVV